MMLIRKDVYGEIEMQVVNYLTKVTIDVDKDDYSKSNTINSAITHVMNQIYSNHISNEVSVLNEMLLEICKHILLCETPIYKSTYV